jgi:SNF2 family DNA or RNA helicase
VIKRDNNYTVTGMTYVHGAFASDDITNDNKKHKTSTKAAGGAAGLPKKQKARPPHETARLSHNAMLRQKMTIDESNRLLFMKRHVDVLEPFLDAKVKALLKSDQGNATQVEKMVAPEEKILLASQPDIVTTELRDYQMVGLEWMVGMHSKGVPFILGDEMGLGELYIIVCVFLLDVLFCCVLLGESSLICTHFAY